MSDLPSSTLAASQEADEKLDFKQIIPIFVIVLIDLLGLTIIIPVLPLYAASFSANAFTIGALGATYPILQFFGAPVLGRLSDRFGRRPVLIISQFGTLIGFLILGFSNSLFLLFLSRFIDGLSGANIATAQAAITDSTTEKTRTQGLGLIGAAFGLGFIIGPVIAFLTLAVSDNNYRVTALVAAAFSFFSILLSIFWLKETLPPEKRAHGRTEPREASKAAFGLSSMWQALQRPGLGFLLALMFTQQFAFGGFEQLLALFTLNRLGLNASGNSAVFVFVGVIVVAVQGGLVGRWSRRYGDRWLIIMGLSTLGLGLLLSAITPSQPVPWYSRAALTEELSSGTNLPDETPSTENIQIELPDDQNKGWLGIAWLLAALIPTSIGGGVLQPSINSLITKQVRPDEIGGILGISSAFLSGSNAITPLIMGGMFQIWGSTAPFLFGGLILLTLWVIASRVIVKPQPQ